MARGRFLQRVSLEQARRTAAEAARLTAAESISCESSHGRVTAEPVYATFPSPHYRAAAMDGIAVRAADTRTAGDTRLELRDLDSAASAPSDASPACRVVDTGNPLPDWADAVIRIEDTTKCAGGFQIAAPVTSGRDVRRIGEDIDVGTRLIPRGQIIRPFDVGAMLATGVRNVNVRRPVSVACLATGSEIVEPGDTPQAGKIIEYNARMLAGFATQWGAASAYLGRVADDRDTLAARLTQAAKEHDIVCVIAGSSAGRKDFTVDALGEIGKLHYHGIDMMPGKPASFATVAGTPVLGIPGYPVSAVVAYREVLEPIVAACLGRAPSAAETMVAQVRRKIPSRLGVEEFLRVALNRDGDSLVAAQLPRGAGSVSTLVRADGILRIGPGCEGIEPGTEVQIELLRPRGEIGDTVVVAGRPDSLSAELEDACRRSGSRMRLTHLGLSEFDSVEAMVCGEADLAVLSLDDGEIAAHLASRLPHCTKIAVPLSKRPENRSIAMRESFRAGAHGRSLFDALSALTDR